MSATRYSEAVILNKMTDLIKLANVNLNHFPRHEKYGLSQEIRRVMYDVYNLIVEGEKRYHKKTSLTELDTKHQQLRMMLKLAYELGYFKYHNEKAKRDENEESRRYMALNLLVNEVGAMIGGWIKSEFEKLKQK
ncbi:MAG: four helix bundle protein [Sulfurimonas sp.]